MPASGSFSYLGLPIRFCLRESYRSVLYAGVVFLAGLVNNIFLYGAVLRAAKQTHVVVRDSWLSIAYWPFASQFTCIFLCFSH